MSDDIRNEIRRLLKEATFSQAEVVEQIKSQYGYKTNCSEFSSAMSGLNTPKARKLLTAALTILTEEKMRQKALLDAAKSV